MRRDRLLHARVDRARMWLFDLIAGAPDKVPAHHAVTHRMAERVAARATAHLDPNRANRPAAAPTERAADQRRRIVQAGRVRSYRARSARRRGP